MKLSKKSTGNFNLIFLLIAISITACKQTGELKSDNVEKMVPDISQIKQNKTALLNGSSKAVCYSGFRTGQHPDRGDGGVYPGDEEILEDLNIISKNSLFSLIRLYDSGENSESVLRIIKDNKLDIKVLLGIWLKAEISNHEKCWWLSEPIPDDILSQNKVANKKEIETAVRLANEYKDIVIAINVGNEALVEWNDHLMNVDTVISYVKEVQSFVEQDVTVADNFDWWALHGKKLAKVVDFVSIHVYPAWEGIDVDEALPFSIKNVQKVRDSLKDVRIVITEAGWASVASEFGERASEEKQLQYFNELMDWSKEMNITTFFFEAFDEDWKGNPDNAMGAEKHWGLFTVDRKPKLVMKEYFPEL